jgi:tRNA (cytidine/uridine-2'-O-)-methyltransferase
MFNIVLYQPEIPPNAGNIIRLCANTGCSLHLIEPLGFHLDNRLLIRAGLDYHEFASLKRYKNFEEWKLKNPDLRIIGFSTKAEIRYTDFSFKKGDALLFGPETRGLPNQILEDLGSKNLARIPMISNSRSMNLSNSVAVATFEAWRQLGFPS